MPSLGSTREPGTHVSASPVRRRDMRLHGFRSVVDKTLVDWIRSVSKCYVQCRRPRRLVGRRHLSVGMVSPEAMNVSAPVYPGSFQDQSEIPFHFEGYRDDAILARRLSERDGSPTSLVGSHRHKRLEHSIQHDPTIAASCYVGLVPSLGRVGAATVEESRLLENPRALLI